MIAIVIATLALVAAETIARRGRADPARWGAPGTKLSLASGLGLLATTVAATASGKTEWIGFLPIATGIALRFAAIRALGDAFTSETVFVPGRPIVDDGVFRWIRHPSDLGLVLCAGGIATLGASAFAIAIAALVVVPSAVLRVLSEEKFRPRSGGY